MLISLVSYFNLCLVANVDTPSNNLEERMNILCSLNGLRCIFNLLTKLHGFTTWLHLFNQRQGAHIYFFSLIHLPCRGNKFLYIFLF